MSNPDTTVVEWSHRDHALTDAHIAFVEALACCREGFFAEEFPLPADLQALPCALHGPLMGDPPVPEADVIYLARSDDRPPSRLTTRAPRPSRVVTVVGYGPRRVFTAYGGLLAPREPGDPTLATDAERAESAAFWAEHALSVAGSAASERHE